MNKKLISLISILIVLILIIIVLFINIQNKSTFKKPKFDEFATSNIPNELKYKESVINISDGYSIYIDGIARKEEDNLIINFVSIESNNIWIKIRITDEGKNVIAESGLIKPGEYLKSIKLRKQVSENENITYMIMGYEKDNYMSAGTVSLNTKVGV